MFSLIKAILVSALSAIYWLLSFVSNLIRGAKPVKNEEKPYTPSDLGSATHLPPDPSGDVARLLEKHGNDLSNLILDGYDFSSLNLRGYKFVNSSLRRSSFQNCDLSYADFRGANLYRADLSGTTLYVTHFHGSDLTRAKFHDARIYGAKMYSVDLTRAEFDDSILDERMANSYEDYIRAAEIYYKLKRAHKENGLSEQAARFYVKERICRRHALKRRNLLLWAFDYIFGYSLSGYGESLRNVFLWSLAVVMVSAVLYLVLPIVFVKSYLLAGDQVLGINRAQSGIDVAYTMLAGIYFSLTTFLTSSPSNYTAVGAAEIIYALESLLGVFLVSVAITVYVRKIIRD